MSPAGRVDVLLASAGTGKTRRLTSRLLALYLDGAAPERVLASTFTRKAAGEILTRLFTRLVAAAGNADEASALGSDVGRSDLTSADARALLVRLVRGIHRLRISTLDAFFVRLAQVFAFELGLPPSWTIGDEAGEVRLRDEVIARVLSQASAAEIAGLLEDLAREGAGRRAHSAVVKTVEEVLGLALDSEAHAWNALTASGELSDDRLRMWAEALQHVEPATNKDGSPKKHWVANLAKLAAAVSERDWEGLLENGLVKKVGEGADSFDRGPITTEQAEVFRMLALHASALLVRRLCAQNVAARALLDRAIAAEGALRFAGQRYRFDALPRLLAGADAIAGEMHHRLGGEIEHLLLDEFQDTSAVQWRVLEPLVNELAARKGASFFCVGDPKQSIYVWRDAEPRLLLGLPERLDVQAEPLIGNWRSSPAVLAAVNRVFEKLHDNAAWDDRELECAVACEFSEQFTVHEARRVELPGIARLWTAPEALDSAAFKEQPALDRAIELAAEVHAADPTRRIAILLRRNKHVTYLLQRLKQRGVAASGEGGNPLTDSAAVNAALSILELADHPADTLVRFHVATSPFAQAVGLSPQSSNADARDVARRIRRELSRRGAAAYFESLSGVVRERFGPFDRRRFGRLIELAARSERDGQLRPAELALELASRRVEEPGSSAVQVMTVHKAKGLEFDAVILPELDSDLLPRSRAWLARRAGENPTAPYDAVSRSDTQELRTWVPELADLYRSVRRREVREALCVLYVAMTRAVHQLDLIVAPSEKEELPSTFAGVLRGALAPGVAPPATLLWSESHGHQPWHERARARAELPPAAPRPAEPARIAFAGAGPPRERTRVSPSSLENAAQRSVEELLRARTPARDRGLRVHAWFEQVEWLEDFALEDAALLELARERGLDGPLIEDDLRDFRQWLARPNTRALLSRAATSRRLGTRENRLEVWRERSFAQRLDEPGAVPVLLHGTFDRAVVVRGKSEIERAEVIDFKTDRLDGSEELLLTRIEHYRPQLDAYRGALARIAGVAKPAVACRMLFVELDRVCDL